MFSLSLKQQKKVNNFCAMLSFPTIIEKYGMHYIRENERNSKAFSSPRFLFCPKIWTKISSNSAKKIFRFHLGIRIFSSKPIRYTRTQHTNKIKSKCVFPSLFCKYFSPINMKWLARQQHQIQTENYLSENECTQNNNWIALLRKLMDFRCRHSDKSLSPMNLWYFYHLFANKNIFSWLFNFISSLHSTGIRNASAFAIWVSNRNFQFSFWIRYESYVWCSVQKGKKLQKERKKYLNISGRSGEWQVAQKW